MAAMAAGMANDLQSQSEGHIQKAAALGILEAKRYSEDFGPLFDAFEATMRSLFECSRKSNRRDMENIIKFVEGYADNHPGEDLSLSRFAEMLHFHPFYLSRLFKRISGIPLSDFIINIRLKKARELLVGTNKKVVEIASELGFGTSSYFTRVFKQNFGKTPQEYRNTLK